MTDETILERVRKLLAKAEDRAATPAEAEAFSLKAEELMAKHSIDMAMIADIRLQDKVVMRTIDLFTPHLDHQASLLYNVAKALGVKGAYVSQRHLNPDWDGTASGKYVATLGLIGFETDVEWVETLFTSLAMQRVNALTAALREKNRSSVDWKRNENGRTFAKAFNFGFCKTVVARLNATRKTAVDTAQAAMPSGTSVALVLVSRDEQVEKEYRVHFPFAKERHTSVKLASRNGLSAGQAAGSAANIARGSVGGAGRALNA